MPKDFAGPRRRFQRAKPQRPPPAPFRRAPLPAARHDAKISVLGLAADVIRRADRNHPADATLREALRRTRGLSHDEARDVSHAVFACYRWSGWLEPGLALAARIRRALELAEDFAARPQGFPDHELVQRVGPAWLREQVDMSPAWARAIQAEPRLWLRARRGQGNRLAETLGMCRVSGEPAFADAVHYRGEQDLFRTREFQAGEFEIQDISSQAVGLLCAPQPGETWWDACAGEGGKTLHLSDLMENQGLIWASDRSLQRLQILKRRAARARCFNYRSAPWDGTARLPTKTKFDGVLVDAPCSGVGTWQRNPHARWTVTPADVRELAEVQKKLLAHVAAAVKPGGKLIYAACTLTRAETVEVVDWFNQQAGDFEPLHLPRLWTRDQSCPASATATIWPQESEGNGMFVAGWRRAVLAGQ